jgi:cobalt-zinc-cadmium efflux system membrane fusion protein
LSLAPGDEAVINPAGMPDRADTAKVLYIGREVEPDSHSVPVVALLKNVDGLLRPGMYATALLPIGPARQCLAVPAAAVMQHEGKQFVFVADGPRAFRRVDVETGIETEDWTEVRSGLSAGMNIVERGAFLLKEELLLEREAEE